MSNQERDPVEVQSERVPESRLSRLSPREVPLGGIRALTVWRTLPQFGHTTIGSWCFIDHYGPTPIGVDGSPGMHVPPHPHTGLQTVSWLFAGEIEHRDSVGSHALVRPGDMNLMTAGAGIQHSEYATAATRQLHGVQLWAVLPDEARHHAPFFEQVPSVRVQSGPATVQVFLGAFAGARAEATTFTDFFGAQVELPAGSEWVIPVDVAHEHGVLVDHGSVRLSAHDEELTLAERDLGFAPVGSRTLTLRVGEAPARVLVLGGAPFTEPIVMWWNFIGRSHDDILAARERWQREVIAGENHAGLFGDIAGDHPALPAPELPTVRLKPRRARAR